MNLAALEDKLADPVWRLTSGELYKIAPADGTGIQPFMPRPEQVKIIRAIFEEGVRKMLIPKARRLGMSTTLGMIAADSLLFRKSFQGSLVDQNAADASRKLHGIVKVALENLPPWLQSRLTFDKSNDSQVSTVLNGKGGKHFYAGMNARGGSNDFLWVSEWGVIQHEDPKRSAKIRSGALPSARHGVTVVETTWAGGRGGDVWELLEPSLTGKADDWKVLFFPWWIDPRNVSETAVFDDNARAYFTKIGPRLEREGIRLTEPQMRWWAAERREQGIFMARENPTFLDECWSAPIKGAIYAEAIEQARTQGRIFQMQNVDGSSLVHTSWDLGSPRNTVVWYWQIVGREIRFIDCDIVPRDENSSDEAFQGTLTERVAYMLARPYNYGSHYVPHDAQQTERTGLTVASVLTAAGLRNVVAVPKCHSVWVGINHALELFPNISFRSPHCDKGLEALACYRMKTESEGTLSTNEPVHDWASHPADGFRTMAEAHRAGLVKFAHTTAPVREDYYGRPKRKGMKPMRVS